MSPMIDASVQGSGGGGVTSESGGGGVRWRIPAARGINSKARRRTRSTSGSSQDDGQEDDHYEDNDDNPVSEEDDDDDEDDEELEFGGESRGSGGRYKKKTHRPGGMSKDDSDPSLMRERRSRVRVGVFRRGGKRRSADDSVIVGEDQKSMGSSGHSHGTGTGTSAGPNGIKGLLGRMKRRGKRSGSGGGGAGELSAMSGMSSVAGSVDHSIDGGYGYSSYPYGGSGDDMSPNRAVSFDFSAMSNDSAHPPVQRGGGGGSIDRSSDHMISYSFDSNATSTHHPGERARYSVHHGKSGNKRKMRVKPYHSFPDAVYMTEEDIYADSLAPTKKVDFLRSYLKPSSKFALRNPVSESTRTAWGSPHDDGRIGALRVEVLGCISLARQKPDVLVYAVCGDAAFATDVLAGYRSPMWPSSARRGAVFPLMHGYAKLFVGVFDVKARKNKDNDVFCGRVVLDVATMRPDTEYDVTFPLRASSFVYDRKARGVVRLRFGVNWFNERAPVWSYWKRPKSLALSSPCHGGLPTIPCADPKTFRNVAVTVYGQDYPGKYTKNAFRATMREFNLYQQNIRQMVKILILNAVMYEYPLISLYLFVAGMHCVWLSSIRLLPPYAVGYVLILFLQNHQHYVAETKYNLGYKPLTLWEVARGFFFHYRPDAPNFDVIRLQKRTKKRKNKGKPAVQKGRRNNSVDSAFSSTNSNEADPDKEVEIEPLDHREFPFADRDAYPKFSVEDALAASKSKGMGGNRRASTTRLHGRLSVYYGPTEPEHEEPAGKPDSEDDSDDESDDDRDDESCVSEGGMGDMIYGMDMNDEFDDLEMDIAPKDKSSDASALLQPGDKASKQRIRVGPPQNTDSKSSKKIPPQVHLMKVEKILHKLTRSVALEMMHPPPAIEQAAELKESASKKDKTATDAQDAQLASLKRKKVQLDEFDRMLGLQSESRNPITRITATFLGPLMRMFRVFIYLFRIAFNISTWRDPYMSFWVCLGLVIWCVILIWFPWRAFFLLVTVATVGPQNMFLRYYLEKKAEKKRKKELEEAEEKRLAEQAASGDDYGYGVAEPQLAAEANAVEEKAPLTKSETTQPTGNSFFSRVFAKRAAAEKVDDEDDDVKVDRPAFRTDPYEKVSSNKKSQARSIVIPYTRFKPDRFFDWPPDPTVSRATPLRQEVEREDPTGIVDYEAPAPLPPMWMASDNASVDESYDVSTDDYGADLLGDDSQDDDSPVRESPAKLGTVPSSRTMERYGYGNDKDHADISTSGLRRRHVGASGGGDEPHEPPLVHSQAYEDFEEEVEDYEYQDYYE